MDDENVKEILPVLRVVSFIPFFLFCGSILYILFNNIKDSTYEKKVKEVYTQLERDHTGVQSKRIGGFRITAYCSGKCCNGKWYGKTAKGRSMSFYLRMNIKIAAVDPHVIPLGTWLKYDGRYYLAADTGSYIKGRRIDLLMNDHRSTVGFGVKYNQTIEVFSNEKVMSKIFL